MDGAPVRKKGLLLLQAKVPVNRYLLSHYQFVHAYISLMSFIRGAASRSQQQAQTELLHLHCVWRPAG